MASNYVPSQAINDPSSDASQESQQNVSQQQTEGLNQLSSNERWLSDNGFQTSPNASNRTLNDAQLIHNRRINVNHKTRSDIEFMCEDKVSKYKLEEVHCSLPSSVKSTFIMTFSPDGQRVASTHGDHRIYICDLITGKFLDTLEGHPKTPWCLAWHPSNKEILASGCLAGEVRVWDLKSKACEIWTSANNTIISSLDFHPKERVLVIATANDVLFWDWSESEPYAKTTTSHEKEKVKFVMFDSSGTKLITGISNLPIFAGYSSDSLQNRIIDSYLTQGNLDQLPTENMTQNSEITSPIGGTLNSNETFNERNATLSAPRQIIPGANNNNNNNEFDVNNRCTLTLYRVAFLYRQLEALEDSMRTTTFSPFIGSRSVSNPPVEMVGINSTESQLNRESAQQSSDENDEQLPRTSNIDRLNPTDAPPTNQTLSQESLSSTTHQIESQPSGTGTTSNTLEPFVMSFDESLVNLRLVPLTLDGQIINLDSVIEQYPIDLSHQLHFVIQYESISQTNQNFIRISKLMSSIRLYRQVVQQILSNNSGQSHFQPNQILTAQSVSPRSMRSPSNLPIVLRPSSVDRNSPFARSNDPILAIQFRNSARNVPILNICKIDLLSARSVCIMRSQQLIEQATSSLRLPNPEQALSGEMQSSELNVGVNAANRPGNRSHVEFECNIDALPQFYPLLNQMHQAMTAMIHAPLTTSNVHTHLLSLRNNLNKLLETIATLFQTQEEGRKLIKLIHNIAESLTGRNWSIPLGANLDDIRLDVIHTICIVDLTLHLTRHVQLIQMQRLSAFVRIEESRRTTAASLREPNSQQGNANASTQGIVGPESTPIGQPGPSGQNLTMSKRKGSDLSSSKVEEDTQKRRKIEPEPARVSNNLNTSDTEMIDMRQTNSTIVDVGLSPNAILNDQPQSLSRFSSFSSSNMQNTLPESLLNERIVLWNSPPARTMEQTLPRFLLATAPSMMNSHIFVRIYHRLQSSSNTIAASNLIDNLIERPNLSHESRRRALSQDNSVTPGTQESSTSTGTEPRRSRHQVNYLTGLGYPGTLFAEQPLPRNPQLHVYQTRGAGQHLWFNQWTIPLPVSNSNYRLQCWNFSIAAIPNIKDLHSNIVTQKCRIHNDASIDVSNDGGIIACLVPRDDACIPNFDIKVFSLRSGDFGVCYYQWPSGPNAISISLSPSASFAVVGLASNKFISNDPNDDDLTIAKVFKFTGKHPFGYVRDIKTKRDELSLSLNAIRWMRRGIVYNVGPQYHQRYQATRMRNNLLNRT